MPSADTAAQPAGAQATQRVAVFFVRSPLHYLAARRVALDHEAAARRVLVCYGPGIERLGAGGPWDAVLTIAWPRHDPLPGPFGRHRRLLENVRRVAAVVGSCETLVLHSPVFDTEAINYFVNALVRTSGARSMHARILPDGLLNIERYPLNLPRRLAQHLRRLRRLASPLLDYRTFSGDRIGSDAPFVDRIYVLAGFPHRYRADRVVSLGPLVEAGPANDGPQAQPRALVVGQPLVAVGLLDEPERARVAAAIGAWLQALGIERIDYKAHPREREPHELSLPGYSLLEIDEPLETWIARAGYAVVVGCCSTALFTAREICGPATRVAAFGVEQVRFKGAGKRSSTLELMRQLDIEIH